MSMLARLANTGGAAPLYVDDVFQTVVRTGTGATATVTTGFQPDLVWAKSRSDATAHYLFDSARGSTAGSLSTNLTNAQNGAYNGKYSFLTNGYSLTDTSTGTWEINGTSKTYVDWVFKKKAKFFDVVTYTGNGVAGRQIAHSLGVVPGMVIVKRTDSTSEWFVHHRFDSTKYGQLHTTNAFNTTAAEYVFGNNSTTISPTASVFTVGSDLNTNGATYVAYLFAHDPSADGIIQCGSFTASGSGTYSGSASVNLGWEPQFLLMKEASNNIGMADWTMMDVMRGWTTPDSSNIYGAAKNLSANLSSAESTFGSGGWPTANGFQVGQVVGGATYIYLAIRRPNKPPTTGTQVYSYGTRAAVAPAFISGFPVDWGFWRNRVTGSNWWSYTRALGGTYLSTDLTSAEIADSAGKFDYQNGFYNSSGTESTISAWMFRRAPGVFDVVCYTGTGSGIQTVSHGLGVVPELVINKSRSTRGWTVFQGSTTTLSGFLRLNETTAKGGDSISVSATTFEADAADGFGMNAAENYVTYLFATLPGVSKVGSYTGNGSSQTINCGFSTGARFVLIKRTDSTGDWLLSDSTRGIIAASDPRLSLNSTAAEVTNDDWLDPDGTGFVVNQTAASNANVSGASYIFLALA